VLGATKLTALPQGREGGKSAHAKKTPRTGVRGVSRFSVVRLYPTRDRVQIPSVVQFDLGTPRTNGVGGTCPGG
jgi:hypothetical protein